MTNGAEKEEYPTLARHEHATRVLVRLRGLGLSTMLPTFKPNGDLPEGIHVSDWPEIETRFGKASEHRTRAYARLRHLYELASRTGRLARFIVFGSFVSATIAPRDIDVLLVMTADFRLEEAPRESRTLFSHAEAEARFSASVFWV